ncbi:hypothetical protein SDC9_143043 [bioreactor metagenome]|uniref:Uncharacterized protein n=1 Tax=bioreactor metagenome TaxID=1076179 RepID=A0A645E2H2_9ZZZZ
MALPVIGNNLCCLFISKVLNALLCLEREFDPEPFVLGIEEGVGMRPIPIHMPVGLGNTTVSHGDGHLMQGLRKVRPEIPVVLSRAHIGPGVTLHRMVEVWKEHRVTEEEDRGVVAYKIPVAFIGIELHGKAADITFCIRCSPLSCHC